MSPARKLPVVELDILSAHLAKRRKAILRAWRKAADADPEQTTAQSLTGGQFNDHIPQVLDAFERSLRARPGGAAARAAELEKKDEEVKHGLHRWQQGYRLRELMNEWGHLQLVLFDELNAFALAHPGCAPATLAEANRQMITLVNQAISRSTSQYERMQQAEAAGHVGDLMGALSSVNEIEHRRAELIHQAVHDISSNIFGVTIAANLLGETDLAEARRAESAQLLKQGIEGVTAMLGELMDLARLEAGQERREISRFNVAAVLTEQCGLSRPFAGSRSLFLELSGPPGLAVDGDSGRVRRLLQNLLSNALKYTVRGGVTVSWGKDKGSWWLMVSDTGPGLLAGPGAPMLVGLKEATASARESDEKDADTKNESSHVLNPDSGEPASRPAQQRPGEGIGLSIVKRLCELLDASLELASSAVTGTTFRVVFPCRYRKAAEGEPAKKKRPAGRRGALSGSQELLSCDRVDEAAITAAAGATTSTV